MATEKPALRIVKFHAPMPGNRLNSTSGKPACALRSKMTLWNGSTDSSPPPSVSPCTSTVVCTPSCEAFSIHHTRSTQRRPYMRSESRSRARISKTNSDRSPPKLKTPGTSEVIT